MSLHLILTCEHAGNQVPKAYRHLFAGHEKLLQTHRGWDPGAIDIARYLSKQLREPLHLFTVTRLLVEGNRTWPGRNVFSEFSRGLPHNEKERILARYYHPFRNAVREEIVGAVSQGNEVLHLSVHTFTPVMDGVERSADIGILFDPARKRERGFASAWQQAFGLEAPEWRVRRNYPYRGSADGHTRALRKLFRDRDYAGIELEVNQRYFLRETKRKADLLRALAETLMKAAGR